MAAKTDNIRFIDSAAAPIATGPQAEGFYTQALRDLSALGLPFLVAGTYAVSAYTGISRPTKDLDVFCKAGDYPRILSHFQEHGYAVEIEDERWIGKVHKGKLSFDVIFASSNGTMPVNDQWFTDTRETEVVRRARAPGRPNRAALVEGVHPGAPPL